MRKVACLKRKVDILVEDIEIKMLKSDQTLCRPSLAGFSPLVLIRKHYTQCPEEIRKRKLKYGGSF